MCEPESCRRKSKNANADGESVVDGEIMGSASGGRKNVAKDHAARVCTISRVRGRRSCSCLHYTVFGVGFAGSANKAGEDRRVDGHGHLTACTACLKWAARRLVCDWIARRRSS